MKLYRSLAPWAQTALVVAAVVGLAALALHYVTLVHRVRQAEQRVCFAKLEAVKLRNAFAERWLLPADPCFALEIFHAGDRGDGHHRAR